MVLVTDDGMSLEQWWNDNDGKPKCLQKKLFQCRFDHDKSKLGLLGERPGINCESYCTVLKNYFNPLNTEFNPICQ